MAKKEQVKPLFAVKKDFYDSLDQMTQQAIMLVQICEQLLEREQVTGPGKSILAERTAAFRAALTSDK